MKAFGLTGNIGCGKSTVAGILSGYPGVTVIDCDRIAKEIISNGAHDEEIAVILGTEAFSGGNADLKAIARIIFNDPKMKRSFEGLLHPLVWAAVEKKAAAAKVADMAIVESAIIYETGSEGRFDAVIVAACEAAEQFRRLEEDRGMSRSEIMTRLAQQMPSSEKEAMARFVIHTDCSLEELENRAGGLYRLLKQQKGML